MRDSTIEVLLANKIGGAVNTGYCRAHGTLNRLIRSDRRTVQKSALAPH